MEATASVVAVGREDAEEFTGALGQIMAGAVRLAEWAPNIGIPEALDLSPAEWAERRLAGAVKLSIAERRAVVAANPDKSTRQLGEALGVGNGTIARDREALAVPNGTSPDKDAPENEGPDDATVPNGTRKRDLDNGDLTPAADAAAKDAARKQRGKAKRESKQVEDEQAPALGCEFHHGSFADLVDTLADGSISLLLTDPPYGARYRSGFRWASDHKPINGDATVTDATGALTDALTLLEPKLAYNAHLLVFCRWREEPAFRDVIEQAGWTLRSGLIWVKNEPGMGDLDHSFGPMHERILHATRGDARMRYREPDTLTCPRVVSNRHPTEKPVELLERLVKATTNPRELVADPFAGVASTLAAASNTGRRGWGTEIDADYHAAGAERLA